MGDPGRPGGRAKASMDTIAYDEFEAGRAENIHARLYAELLDDLRLSSHYEAYPDAAPPDTPECGGCGRLPSGPPC